MLKLTKRVSAFAGAIALSLGGMFTLATPAFAAATPSDGGVVQQQAEPLAETDDTTLETTDAAATEATGETTAPDDTTDATAESSADATDGTEPAESTGATDGTGATDDTEATDDTGETQEVSPFASDGPMEDVTPVTLTLGQASYTQAETTAGVTWSAVDMTPNDRVIVSVGGVRLESDIVAGADGTASGTITYTIGTGFSLAAAGATSDPFPVGTYLVVTEQDLGLGTHAEAQLVVTGDGLGITLGQTTYSSAESADGITWSVTGLPEGSYYYLYVNGKNIGGSDVMDNVPDASGNASGVIGFQEYDLEHNAFFVPLVTGLPVPYGLYTLEVRITDAAGADIGSAMATFFVNEEAPTAPVNPALWVQSDTITQAESINGVSYGGTGWLPGLVDAAVTLPSGETVGLDSIETTAEGSFEDTLIYYVVDTVTGEPGEQLPFPAGQYTIRITQAGADETVSFTVTDEGLAGGGDWENPGPKAGDGPNAPSDTADALATTGASQAAIIGMLAGAGVLLLLGGTLVLVRRLRSHDS